MSPLGRHLAKLKNDNNNNYNTPTYDRTNISKASNDINNIVKTIATEKRSMYKPM